jgi:hypothetical protein
MSGFGPVAHEFEDDVAQLPADHAIGDAKRRIGHTLLRVPVQSRCDAADEPDAEASDVRRAKEIFVELVARHSLASHSRKGRRNGTDPKKRAEDPQHGTCNIGNSLIEAPARPSEPPSR